MLIKVFQKSELELEYRLTGDENGETILFVHGVGSNLRQFSAQHQYFSENYQVLSVSLRGHGNSSAAQKNTSEEYTLKKNCDDLLQLLDYLSIEKVHFVGNSAGGLIGYELLASKPTLFSSLITFGTTAQLKVPDFTTNVISYIDRLMMTYNPKGYATFLAKHSSEYSHTQREVAKLFSSVGKGIYLRKNIGNYSYIPVLEKMDIPYLLIQGEDDEDINENLTTTLNKLMHNDNASIVTLERAGHFVNLEQPEIFNKILDDFIKRSALM